MTFTVTSAPRDAAGTRHGELSGRGNSYITRVDGQRVPNLRYAYLPLFILSTSVRRANVPRTPLSLRSAATYGRSLVRGIDGEP